MKWFAHFVSVLFRNPEVLALVATAVESDPSVPPEVRQDFDVVMRLGPIWAAKQPGTLVYKLDADGTEQTIAHIAP